MKTTNTQQDGENAGGDSRGADFGNMANAVSSQASGEGEERGKDGEQSGKRLDVIEEEQLLQANNSHGEKGEPHGSLSPKAAASANKRRSRLLDKSAKAYAKGSA